MTVVVVFWILVAIALSVGLYLLHRRKCLLVTLFSLTLSLLFYESVMTWWLPNAARFRNTPEPLLDYGRRVYENVDMNIIHLEPEYSRYDPELTYTLRPGTFTLSNHEFDARFDVNALGFRDDAESLQGPEIVVVGDSYAMGWGVDQDKTFAHVIEEETGYRVLNLAVSSYGTVREMRSLNRIDRSKLKYLIVQYCDNDYVENQSFQRGTLSIRGRASYEKETHDYSEASDKRNSFGKYTRFHVTEAARRINAMLGRRSRRHQPERGSAEEVRAFFHALIHASQAKVAGLQVIVLFLSDHRGLRQGEDFLRSVNALKRHADYPAHIQRLVTVELQDALGPEHYFVLDGHINDEGHDMVAREIMKVLAPKSAANADQ
jgi:hypothetical protein